MQNRGQNCVYIYTLIPLRCRFVVYMVVLQTYTFTDYLQIDASVVYNYMISVQEGGG